MQTYFNYITREIEDICSVQAFYLVACGGDRYKLIASPEPLNTMNSDRLTRCNSYWLLTWAQIEPHLAELFPHNQLRDEPLGSDEIVSLFGLTHAQLELDRQFFSPLILAGHNVNAMIHLLSNSTNPAAIRPIVSELRELANPDANPLNQSLLAEAGVIPPLVRCLGFLDSEIQELAAGTLFNLIYQCPDNQTILYEEQGIPALVRLLPWEAPAVLRIAAETLHQLVDGEDTLHQNAVREAGGLTLILNLVKKFRMLNEDANYWLLKLLKELLVNNELNQNTVLAADGIQWLLPLLLEDSEDDLLRKITLDALDYLALKNNQSQAVFCQAGGIGLLLHLLSQDTLIQTKQAATNLLVILLDNRTHQDLLRLAGGILTLVALINSSDAHTKWLALTLIVYSVQRNEVSQNAIRQAGGIELLLVASLDSNLRGRELAKNALLAVMSNNPSNQSAVHELAHSNEQPVQQAATQLLNLLHQRAINQVVQHGLFHVQATQTDASDLDAPAETNYRN